LAPRRLVELPRQAFAFSSDGGLRISSDTLRIQIRENATEALRGEFLTKSESSARLVSCDGATVFRRTPISAIVMHRRVGGSWKSHTLFVKNPTYAEHPAYYCDNTGQRMTTDPRARRLAVNFDGIVRVFDAETRKIIATVSYPDRSLPYLAISPDGNTLATARVSGEILLDNLSQPLIRDERPRADARAISPGSRREELPRSRKTTVAALFVGTMIPSSCALADGYPPFTNYRQRRDAQDGAVECARCMTTFSKPSKLEFSGRKGTCPHQPHGPPDAIKDRAEVLEATDVPQNDLIWLGGVESGLR
jgi:hypothetical protein